MGTWEQRVQEVPYQGSAIADDMGTGHSLPQSQPYINRGFAKLDSAKAGAGFWYLLTVAVALRLSGLWTRASRTLTT